MKYRFSKNVFENNGIISWRLKSRKQDLALE
jgi:hypothetical protein